MATRFFWCLIFAAQITGCGRSQFDAKASDHTSHRIAQVSAPARIEGADRTIQLASPFQMPVLAVHVQQGQQIKLGDVVASLDCRDLSFDAKALEEEAKSFELVALKLSNGSRKEEVLAARARHAGAIAIQHEAKTREARFSELHAKGMVSQAALDDLRKTSIVQEYEAKTAEANLTQAMAGPLKVEIEAAHRRASAASAKAKAVNEKLGKCDVRSPVNGTVLRLNVRAGEMTDVAGEAIAQIADLSTMRARAEVDEKDIARIKMGTTARVRDEAGLDVPASVVELSPVMGRKHVKTQDPADKTDRDIREVIVRLEKPLALPVGYRVTVLFEKD